MHNFGTYKKNIFCCSWNALQSVFKDFPTKLIMLNTSNKAFCTTLYVCMKRISKAM